MTTIDLTLPVDYEAVFVTLQDIELHVAINEGHPTFYFKVQGAPAVQDRVRARTMNGRVSFYDPTARKKLAFKEAIRSKLVAFGYTQHPIFPPTAVIKLRSHFGLSNQTKDCDNLQKFLMDSLQTVFYTNDNMVYDQHGIKKTEDIDEQYTEFSIQQVL